ncbi:AbrB/MazE/SpoVT family DNA-binding domain-containing protein [Halalkalibaculum sp. DA3122]|uniref:AbrB/MazE/SpoVT family DNA-binding domain-containing protein n=1 Tax=unclassified Halalkalibaculum TaxID=2964617 RepID=UPI0037544286
MEQATVTSKGQITIPKRIREKLNLKAGDNVNFIVDSDDVIKIQTQKKISKACEAFCTDLTKNRFQ